MGGTQSVNDSIPWTDTERKEGKRLFKEVIIRKKAIKELKEVHKKLTSHDDRIKNEEEQSRLRYERQKLMDSLQKMFNKYGRTLDDDVDA